MAKQIVWRALLAGLLAAVPAFVIAKLLAEPQIQAAIDYEGGREAAMQAMRSAAGLASEPGGEELVSRAAQSTFGLATGVLLMGVAYGGFLAVAYGIARRSLPTNVVSARSLALLIAAAGLLTLFVFPALKYPPNPPAVGNDDTIADRTALYLALVGISVCAMIVAVWLVSRLHERFGIWNAALIGAALFLAVQIAAQALLPQLGELMENVAQYGQQSTETPPPLKDPQGTIVFPGFPADVLAKFRLYSFANQTVLWLGLGVVFGALIERIEQPARRQRTAASASGAQQLA